MATCGKCQKVVLKNDVTRSVEVRVIDGEQHTFGYNQPEPLMKARGKLKGVYHYKCWMVALKVNRPTTDERGRYFSTTPTAYEQSATMRNRDDMTMDAKARRARAEAEYQALVEDRLLVHATASEESVAELDKRMRELEEEIALAARQEEIEAQRDLEQSPHKVSDWREPLEMEI